MRIVGEDSSISDEKLASALIKVAADYKRLKAQVSALSPDNPIARGLIGQAKAEIGAGQFARAHELLRQATDSQIAAAQEARKLKVQAQAAEDAQMLGAANSTSAEGEVSSTERNYPQASELFAQAASYVPPGHPDERGNYLARQAGALYEQGNARGDNAALRSAIEVFQQALQELTRARAPLDWAATQDNLGNALEALGERESGTARLQAAVAAYRAALEEQTRDRDLLGWAATQIELGITLEALGEREAGTASLEASVETYRAALEVLTVELDPNRHQVVQREVDHIEKMLAQRQRK